MNQSNKHPILRGIASVKLTLGILAVFAVAIAVATFVEVRYGSVGARALVYNALWFEALLGLLVLNLIASLVVHFPYHVRQTGFVITHIGFIVVIVASGITRYQGYEGTMPIREGTSTDFMYSAQNYVGLKVDGEYASFPVRLYKPGENSIKRNMTVNGERFRVSLREYWPSFEMRLVEGASGFPAIAWEPVSQGHVHQQVLKEGREFRTGDVALRFVAQDKAPMEIGPGYGELSISVGDEAGLISVPRVPPVETEVAGHRFRITELAPRFQVGTTPSPTDPMTNPAIRVEIEGPDGTKEERLLFAFHPDFDMGHGDREVAFEDIEMRYTYSSNVYLFRVEEGLVGIADAWVEIETHGPDGPARNSIEPGARFALREGDVMGTGNFAIVIRGVWESAVEKPVISEDSDRPAAVRLVVEDSEGSKVEKIVEQYAENTMVTVGDRQVVVSYGPEVISLPYRLHLDDFQLITYPGSNNPASFESHVRLFDDERGVQGDPVRIYMNHPLTYRGFKHFQSSYDRDRRGTILSVNHDPGKLPTYLGYILVGVGFLVTLTRGMWYRRSMA